MKNILFFGGSSLLATVWANYWKERYNIFLTQHQQSIQVVGVKLIQIQKISEAKLKTIILSHDIDLLINCVGLTSVEQCQLNPTKANYLNAEVPSILAKICFEQKVDFIQISTDHLFEGIEAMKSELDIPKPLNQYAYTKLKGEQNSINNNSKALIIRTNFFGVGPNYKPSFSDIITSALKCNQKIKLFNDVFFTPIHIHELADIVLKLLKENKKGIYNVVSNERISKYDFGILIAESLNLPKSLILQGSISKRKDLVKRPKDMSLSNDKLKTKLNIKINTISNQIKCLTE
jgi:dTDP-4-dehydrorhamnose reductase